MSTRSSRTSPTCHLNARSLRNGANDDFCSEIFRVVGRDASEINAREDHEDGKDATISIGSTVFHLGRSHAVSPR